MAYLNIILSMDAGKAKPSILFSLKTLKKEGREENFLNPMVGIFEKPKQEQDKYVTSH